MLGLPQQVWIRDLDVLEPLDFTVVALDHELDLLVLRAERVGHEVQRRLLYLDAPAAGIAQREELRVHRDGHVPDDLAGIFVLVGMNVEEEGHDLRAAGAEADGLARLALREPPDFVVAKRPMLDRARDPRPAPAGVNFVEQRARWVAKPLAARFLRLEVIALETGPALQRIMVPAAAAKILVAMKVTVGEDVEPGALLVADDDRQRILKLFPEPDVQHARIERFGPHADVEPPRPRPRARDGRRQHEILRNGKGHLSSFCDE